jgi:hypothetical protein
VSKLLRPLFIKNITMNITLFKRGRTSRAKTTVQNTVKTGVNSE